MRQVLSFLGADPGVPLEQVETKPLEGRALLHTAPPAPPDPPRRAQPGGRRQVARALDSVTPKPLRSDSLSSGLPPLAYGPQRPADEQLMLELRRRFKGEVQAAGDYLGRDLVTLWGYDRIS